MKNNLIILFVSILIFYSCKNDEIDFQQEDSNLEYKIAVVMPLSGGLQEHWNRTLGFVNRNMEIAFKDQSNKISLSYELFDEENEDIHSLAESFAEREDIDAVIGCLYSENAKIMVESLSKAKKNFFTMSTSADLIRANAKHGYLWAMTETDITQCEVLLSKIQNYGFESVALLAKENNAYSQTFIDWFPFQAGELGLNVKGLFLYNDSNIENVCFDACSCETDYIMCIPSTSEEVQKMCKSFIDYDLKHKGKSPKKIFSDTAYGIDILNKYGEYMEGIEGVTFSADPETGFEISYKTFFKKDLSLGEAQLYDACMILYYAFWYQYLKKEENLDLKTCLRKVVDGKDENFYGWMGEDMRFVINAYANGSCPDIKGASGNLNFDKEIYTNVLESTYANFSVYNGKYVMLGYNKSNGGRRTDSTLAGWNWKKTQMQEFDKVSNIVYPNIDEKWVLLVAGSNGWINYRHQADILSVYKKLKDNGFRDDRIILIMEDDIAYNEKNPYQGEIKTWIDESNLYSQVELDYKLSNLSPEDVMNILSGNKTERTPVVIESDNCDNILVFWSGHGTQQELNWGNNFFGVRKDDIANTIKNMSDRNKYRKLLFMIEACYSGSIVKDINVPGALFITAANDIETSKAENFSNVLGVWTTNRFTYGLMEQIETDLSVSIRDLYYRLFVNTIGSHVMVYNTPNFGDIYSNSIEEFFLY